MLARPRRSRRWAGRPASTPSSPWRCSRRCLVRDRRVRPGGVPGRPVPGRHGRARHPLGARGARARREPSDLTRPTSRRSIEVLLDEVARRQAEAVVRLVRAVLDGNVIGAYLHGSAVLRRPAPAQRPRCLRCRAPPNDDRRAAAPRGRPATHLGHAGPTAGAPGRTDRSSVSQPSDRGAIRRAPNSCTASGSATTMNAGSRHRRNAAPTWPRSSRWSWPATTRSSVRRPPSSSIRCRRRTSAAPSSRASQASWPSWKRTRPTSC